MHINIHIYRYTTICIELNMRIDMNSRKEGRKGGREELFGGIDWIKMGQDKEVTKQK